MSLSNLWQRLTGLAKTDARAASNRFCPVGHPMDPHWLRCPMCEAEERAQQPTPRANADPPAAAPANPTPETVRVAPVKPSQTVDLQAAAATPPTNEAERLAASKAAFDANQNAASRTVLEAERLAAPNAVANPISNDASCIEAKAEPAPENAPESRRPANWLATAEAWPEIRPGEPASPLSSTPENEVTSSPTTILTEARRPNMARQPTIVSGTTPPVTDAARSDLAADGNAAPGAQPGQPRLTGALVTFTWKPEGELFPLYEGRNVIGRGDGGSDSRTCNIQVPSDASMSSDHATVLCRRAAASFELVDNLSTNGTFVDDREIGRGAADLHDGDHFRTGATEWLVKRFVDPPQAASESAAASRARHTAKPAKPDVPDDA